MANFKLSPDVLIGILDAMVLTPFTGLKTAAEKFSLSPTTIFRWQSESARDERDQSDDTPYRIEWLGNMSFWHRHVALARRLSILRIDQRLRDLAVNGTREYLFRQGGEPIWQVDPQLAADALDPLTWQLYHGDRPMTDVYKRGPDGELLQSFREIAPNSQILIKSVTALLPEVYGESIRHEVTVGGVLRVGAAAPVPKQIEQTTTLDADFSVAIEDREAAPAATNVLAVASRPESVQAFENTFGGARIVEAVLFYDADGKLLPPLPEIVIVKGSPIDKAYSDAGIEHATTPASELIAQGYVNPFLLKLAAPAESDLVRDLRAKLAAGVQHPRPTHPVPVGRPADEYGAPPISIKPGRASPDIDSERIGHGRPAAGGFRVMR